MSKAILCATLAIVGTLILTDSANAGWRRYRYCAAAPNYVYSYGSTATTSAPVMATNTAPAGSTYQSFSYEPGTTVPAQVNVVAAPVYQAPVVYSQGWSEYNNVLRGDRKVTGH